MQHFFKIISKCNAHWAIDSYGFIDKNQSLGEQATFRKKLLQPFYIHTDENQLHAMKKQMQIFILYTAFANYVETS